MSLLSIGFAALAGTTLALSPGVGSASAEIAIASTPEWTVHDSKLLNPLGRWHLPPLQCPSEYPRLSDQEFHPGSGWRIPRGVEISTDGPIDAHILGRFEENGIGLTSEVTNWSFTDSHDVKITIHCVKS